MSRLDSISLHLKIKIQQNLLILTLILTFIVLSMSILVFESRLTESVMSEIKASLEDTGMQLETQVQTSLSEYRNDLRFLHGTPPVSGLPRALNNGGIDPQDQTPYHEWKARLETIFVAFLQNNNEYQQLRIIDTTKRGMELVRVDRIGGQIKVIEDKNLQSKSDRDYFIASADLADGEIYMSSISLNREFGKIEYPYRPMLRFSLPIFDELGQRFALLVVNIQAEQLLDSLKSLVIPPSELVVTDPNGYFLITPNQQHQFSKDLAPSETWDSNFQVLKQISKGFYKVNAIEDNKDSYFSFQHKIVVAGGVNQRYALARILTPQSYVSNLKMDRRTTAYAFFAAVTVMLLFTLLVFYRSMRKNQQLSVAKAQSAAIVGGSQDAILSINNGAVVTSWNAAAESFFGYDENTAKGKTVAELGIFQDIALPDIIEQLAQGNNQQNAEISITKNAQPRYYYCSFSAIKGHATDVNGVAIIVRDVTIEHLADVKIKQVNAELEEKVASRTKELQKSSHLKSAFISSISHEMRTPLNGIIGTLKLVKNESLSDNQKRYLEMTEVSVSNLSALINDVLDLSKIEAGKLDIDFKPFNPIILIEKLSCNMAIKAQENGLEFIVDMVDLHCHSIVSDAHRFSQILSNLVSNAIKFTESGFIKVSASSQLNQDGQVIIQCSVSDSGVGIAEQNQDKLFTAFTQEYTAVASKYGGTGLGLAICRQLVTLLNGKIDFVSEKDQGSTFSFSIAVPQVDCKQLFVEPILQGKSCLILVPNPESYQHIQRMLQSSAATILEPKLYDEWLTSETIQPPEVVPHLIIIDQQYSNITFLDKKWSQLTHGLNDTPKVLILKNSGDTVLPLKHLVAESLSKPILQSDVMDKVITSSSVDSFTDKNNGQKQQETEVAFKGTADDFATVAGARVLIVDDNLINVEVAKGMLSCLPIELVQAMDGQQALDILQGSIEQNTPIHCILMDCQMPILNGYDASRKIRQGTVNKQYKTIPIIAMTANAMLGEKEKCFEAGMSDYTTKPIDADLLVSKVIQWTLTVYQAPDALKQEVEIKSDKQGQGPESDAQQSDTVEWDKHSALTRLMNNETLLAKICQMFIESSPSKIEALGQSIKNKNYQEIGKLAHSLKGSAGDLGAVYLHQLFSSMEQLAKIPEIEKLEQQYQIVISRYASFIAILNKEFTYEAKSEQT
ncbi:ATP-binding protein [uncultured Paraglaciecola sp.]|uniref:ATP-binding protein n=1 Tax=uncultured Paraglaciecola sp. TaxID=1765024 RepID=UPI002605BE4F|nr:ATP-binding protein [uncultured Paraglaciecola sp.]